MLVWLRWLVGLLWVSIATPMAASQAEETPFVDWSETIGEWSAGDTQGVLRIKAVRIGAERPRQKLQLVWLQWFADQRVFRTVQSLGEVEICGADRFQTVELISAMDATPEVSDIALLVRFLPENASDLNGKTRLLFAEINKNTHVVHVFNCRNM